MATLPPWPAFFPCAPCPHQRPFSGEGRPPAPALLRSSPLELSSGKGMADSRTGQGGPDLRPECPLGLGIDVRPGLSDLIIPE